VASLAAAPGRGARDGGAIREGPGDSGSGSGAHPAAALGTPALKALAGAPRNCGLLPCEPSFRHRG